MRPDPFQESLRRMPQHRLVQYPDHDMHNLGFRDGAFDVVVHSDTLEHVPDSARCLAECRRILAPRGALCFTVPIVVGRMTRTRAGLLPSYHGTRTTNTADLLVHTEFGADVWTMVMQAGFADVSITAFEFPAAIALTAWQESGRFTQPQTR